MSSREHLRKTATQWNVKIDEIRETESSLVGFGVRNGRRVVLKLTRSADEARSGEVLKAFDGDGAVRVY